MSHRNRNILFALMSFAGAGCAAWAGFVENVGLGDPGTAKVVTAVLMLGVVGGIYFLVHAYDAQPGRGPFHLRFIPSPPVGFEFSAQEGAPEQPVTADAIRTALAVGTGFTVADDPEGWLRLTGTIGPPRWVRDAKGEVVAERQFARLALRPGADRGAIRPEDLTLVSTETNLTVNACLALAAAFGSPRVRIRGDSEWFAVVPTVLFAQLAVRLVQTQPPITSFREGEPEL